MLLWLVKRRLAIQLLTGEFIDALLTFFECFTDESKVDFRIQDLTLMTLLSISLFIGFSGPEI